MSALTIVGLNNGKSDLDHIEKVATSTERTTTDRMGNVKLTVSGAIESLRAFNLRGSWAAAIDYAVKDVYTSDGLAYVTVIAHRSVSVAADLLAGKVLVHQGATKEELAGDGGGRLVGVRFRGTNAPIFTTEAGLTESVSLLKYGGRDDFVAGVGGTDNLTPLLGILADYPGGIQIDLPRTNTGIYRFNYFAANILNGFTLNAAPGVVLRFPEAWPLKMAGVKAVRP